MKISFALIVGQCLIILACFAFIVWTLAEKHALNLTLKNYSYQMAIMERVRIFFGDAGSY